MTSFGYLKIMREMPASTDFPDWKTILIAMRIMVQIQIIIFVMVGSKCLHQIKVTNGVFTYV